MILSFFGCAGWSVMLEEVLGFHVDEQIREEISRE